MALVLLSVLAQALVPRASWYVHRHTDGGHDHVHAWDGTRVAGSTASLRDFLPHEHEHGYGHAHHDHDHAVAAHDHEHHDPHAAPADRARTERSRGTAGPALVAALDGAHAHGQAPFQTAVAADVARLAEPRAHAERASDTIASLAVARVHALRARAPPSPRA